METAQNLDESVQSVELSKILPDIAKLLKTETAVVEKAIFYQNMKLSEVVLGTFVSEKSHESLPELLKPSINWTQVLEQKKLNTDDAREYLDSISSEVAFLVFEKKNAKDK